MNPMKVDYTDLEAVKAFARKLAARYNLTQLVVKYPDRKNYNIAMVLREGATLIWSSDNDI